MRSPGGQTTANTLQMPGQNHNTLTKTITPHSRFSYPDDVPGQLPAPPQPWPHAYGAQGHGKLRNSLTNPKASLVYFVVRDDSSSSEVVFQTSDTTWQAYNLYGGANTYYGLTPPFR